MIIHELPGRLRLKIYSKSRDQSYFEQTAKALLQYPQLQKVQYNAVTASILIHSNEALEKRHFFSFAEDNQLFSQHTAAENNKTEPVAKQMADELSKADFILRAKSTGKLDLQSVYFLTFVVLGMYQMSRGQVLGPASSLLWHALQLIEPGNKAP